MWIQFFLVIGLIMYYSMNSVNTPTFLIFFLSHFSFIFYLVIEVFRHQNFFSVQMAHGESEPYRLHATSIPIRNSWSIRIKSSSAQGTV